MDTLTTVVAENNSVFTEQSDTQMQPRIQLPNEVKMNKNQLKQSTSRFQNDSTSKCDHEASQDITYPSPVSNCNPGKPTRVGKFYYLNQ